MRLSIAAALLSSLSLLSFTATAQSWPEKPVKLVVPYPPGGATDLMGRLFQVKLATLLGQSVVIENQGGATGAIGTRAVARSAPDGYTLLFTVGTDLALSRVLSKDSPVDPERDLTPIIAALQAVSCIAASSTAPVKTLAELVAFAKANPGKLTFGTPGVGSAPHMTGEMLRLHGVDLLHVPFKGSGPSLAALVSGQIDLSISNLSTALANARSGKVRVLGMTHAKRYEGLPEIPSVDELVPGAAMPPGWYGFFGPAKLPRAIVLRVNAEVNKALVAPDLKPKIEEATFSVLGGTPEEFAALVKSSIDTYSKIARAARIQAE